MSSSRKIVVEDSQPSKNVPRRQQGSGIMKRLTLRKSPEKSPLSSPTERSQRYRQTAVELDVKIAERVTDKTRFSDKIWYIRDNMFEKQWGSALFLAILFFVLIVSEAALHMLVEYNYEDPGQLNSTEGPVEDLELPWTDESCYCPPDKPRSYCIAYCSSFRHHLWIAWTYMVSCSCCLLESPSTFPTILVLCCNWSLPSD
jgi:hypothetical protein